MIAEERRAHIISELEDGHVVDITDLAAQLQVSEMTIRRDLRQLEREGILRRVHGGAVNSRGRSYEPPLSLRNLRNMEAKRKIGRRAAELIEAGDCIALDIGSTIMEIARNLTHRSNLTVITPSLHIASMLSMQFDMRVILPGGILRPGEQSMIGELAQKAFETIFVDKLFLGVGAMDIHHGLTEFNWDDALVKKAMMKCAKQTIVVADSSKFNRTAFALIGKLTDIHRIVTDAPPPDNVRKYLEDINVVVDVAE